MMHTTALASLPADWRTWVVDNVARACDPEEMTQVMVASGRFERTLARAAVEDARRAAGMASAAPVALPWIDTSVNTVALPDRAVRIAAALATPRIVVLENLLSDAECDELAAHGDGRLDRSPVVASGNGGNQLHAHRTSRGAMLQRGETALVARIETRLAALLHWPADHGEGLQVLRYGIGDEYRPHFDWFDASQPGPRKHLERGGQRVATVVMYLSDVEEGGGTSFPTLGLDVHPRKGGAVYFANVDAAGRPDEKTLHAGMPVVKGVKTIATKWLRTRVY